MDCVVYGVVVVDFQRVGEGAVWAWCGCQCAIARKVELCVPVRGENNVVLDVGEIRRCMLCEGRWLARELRSEVVCATSFEKFAGAFRGHCGGERRNGEETRHGEDVKLLEPQCTA